MQTDSYYFSPNAQYSNSNTERMSINCMCVRATVLFTKLTAMLCQKQHRRAHIWDGQREKKNRAK